MLLGSDVKQWRHRNGYTQEMLRMALGIKSRQTIITWEASEDPIATTVELALMALEFLPEEALSVSGAKFSGFVSTRPRELKKTGVINKLRDRPGTSGTMEA